VEVLIALAIAGLVVGAVHQLLAAAFRQDEFVRRSEAARTAAGTLAAIIERDLSDVYVLGSDEGPLVLSASPGAPKYTTELAFCTASTALDAGRQQQPLVRRVRYALVPAPEPGGRLSLSRAVIPYPGEDAQPQQVTELTRHVVRFLVEASDGREWHDEWPPGEAQALPRAVRVSFALSGGHASEVRILEPFDLESSLPEELLGPRRRLHESGREPMP